MVLFYLRHYNFIMVRTLYIKCVFLFYLHLFLFHRIILGSPCQVETAYCVCYFVFSLNACQSLSAWRTLAFACAFVPGQRSLRYFTDRSRDRRRVTNYVTDISVSSIARSAHSRNLSYYEPRAEPRLLRSENANKARE